jgi:signal transduction histidine kinase
MSNRPPSYLAFLYGKLSTPAGQPIEDGIELGRQCVEQLRALEDREHFPPSLLILLASPAYLEQSKAAQLIAGVHRAFANDDYQDIPLIGSTVAAVFFDQQVHSEGALLVCLASRLVKAKIAIGVDARNNPETAVNDVLKTLGLTPGAKADPNPFADRRILTFLPGFGDDGMAASYPAPELHRRLREGVKSRIWIAGGVSSANDPTRSKSGLQFADRLVLKDAIVTALISSGTPIVMTFGHGLSPTGEYLRVTKLSEDKRIVHEFDDGPAAKVISDKGQYVMLGEMSTSSEPVIDVPREATNKTSVELMREVKNGAFFEVLRPDPKKIQETIEEDLAEARNRIPIASPLACLMLPCNAWRLRYQKMGLEIESLLGRIEELLPSTPCFGGFVDGEIGVDRTGRSLFGNGGVAGLIFGDEMRQRSVSFRGLKALAENVAAVTGTDDLEEAIRKALKIVVETGFPGAKLWLVQRNREEKFVVAKDFIGNRFKKTEGLAIRPLMAHNILAIAARERKPFFIKNSPQDRRCNQKAVGDTGIISQYIVPLLRLGGKAPLGVLQIDLGDLRYLDDLPISMKEVLNSFGSIFSAAFNRIYNLIEARILRLLDQNFDQSLPAQTLEEGLQTLIKKFLDAFDLKIGYVRLANYERRTLTLIAGDGPCYPEVMKHRREVLFDDISPLSRAFLAGGVTTVNDAIHDPAHQQMLKRYEEQYPEIAKHMKEIGSFAAVVLENEAGEKLGVLGIYANQPWFFTPPRIRALISLGNHLSFAVEHFNRKQREEQARRLLQFRSEIWHQPAIGADLDFLPESLKQITSKFRSAIGAETASLYLMDEAGQKLTLRAEDGWIDPTYVNLASYQIGDGWTGNLVMSDEVEYVPDMRAYKQNTARNPHGRFTVQMYGSEIPEASTVESIGLPLKISDQRLGVLTLHRRIPKEEVSRRSGFVTTDPVLLQEGADALTVFVNALLAHREALWVKEEQKRWGEIMGVFAEAENNEILAKRLCRQMVESLNAIQANFYECVEECVDNQYRLIASEALPSQSEIQDWSIPDNLVHLTGSLRRVQIERPGTENRQGEDLLLSTAEGIVERICIPLAIADSLIGVIDLHWNKTSGAEPMLIRDNSSHLKALGNQIASAYHRNKLLSEREESETEAARRRLAVQTMGAMLAQSGHRVINLIQYLKHLPALLTEERPDEDLFKRRISVMEERLKTGAMMIERPLKIGQSIVQTTPQPCSVFDMIQQAIGLAGLRLDQEGPQTDQLVLNLRVPEKIIILADQDQIREAFYNLIHNAIKASPDGGVLTIEANANESQKTARILVADTGEGMTREEVEAAKSGFITTRGHTGLGVLISSLLIHANKGAVEIDSVKGSGTRVTITLPLASKEKAHEVASVSSGR